jgi:RepB DNA-primase from phage plasmid
MSRELTAERYVLENFAAQDRVALLALHRPSRAVLQRITTAATLASPDFQAWLGYLNAQKHDLFLSMNTLKPGSRGRTKGDVDCIRHIFLDFDGNGDRLVERLLAGGDLPVPNYLISTSPDKWQVIWKVEGFAKAAAEELERGLVRSTGADPCVVDVARVLRLPGFYNHKYSPACLVTVGARSGATRSPEDFPRLTGDEPVLESFPRANSSREQGRAPDLTSQSERDWAYAKRALRRGDAESVITEEIARYRAGQKHDPYDYAQRTVRKAIGRSEEASAPGPEDGKQR